MTFRRWQEDRKAADGHHERCVVVSSWQVYDSSSMVEGRLPGPRRRLLEPLSEHTGPRTDGENRGRESGKRSV